MSGERFISSAPDRWTVPPRPADISTRGKIHPMPAEKAGWSDWAIRAFMVGITIGATAYAFYAASDAPASQPIASVIEARAGGKVSR